MGKELDQFFVDNGRANGRTPWCKICFKSANDVRKLEIAEYQKTYYAANKAKVIERKRVYSRVKKQTDIQYRLRKSLRSRLKNYLKGKLRNDQLAQYLGCSYEELRRHLEQKFKPGMTWSNQGKFWHVDHIVPLARLDLTTEEGLRTGLHFSNLQPMTAENNKKKGDRLPVVYLVTGTFGAGKTWICNQLKDYAHYFAYDLNRRNSHFSSLCNPPDFDKPQLYDRNINVNKFMKDSKGILDVRPVFILESEDVIRTRLAHRGGQFTPAVKKKMARMEFLARRYAVFSGTASECLEFLKRELNYL